MAKLTLAAATQFAHLLGRGRPAAGKPRAEDDKPEDREEDKRDARRAEDGDEDERDEDKRAARRGGRNAVSPDEDEKPEGESDEDSEEERKQDGKRARRAEDGDDESEDKEDDADPKARAARRRERARCEAIFASAHAGTRPDMAAHLAFKTSMTRGQALEMLAAVAGGEGRRTALGARMAGMEALRPGADAAARSGKQAVAGSWDAAAARAGITPRK